MTIPTIEERGLVWNCIDARYKGQRHARLQWCADGDGYFFVKQSHNESEIKLFCQGDFVCNLGTDLQQAIALATEYMRLNEPSLFDDLGGVQPTE